MSTFLFNFKRQFASIVESGDKTQTIRKTRKDGRRPVVGDMVKLYTGLRTRKARLLRSAAVVRCRAVQMWYADYCIIVDGQRLTPGEATAFAKADGFPGVSEMVEWFRGIHYNMDGIFEGFVTEWAKP